MQLLKHANNDKCYNLTALTVTQVDKSHEMQETNQEMSVMHSVRSLLTLANISHYAVS